MMRFIAEMRSLSGGKPAGFKLCIGHEWEFLGICKAMLETGHPARLHRRRRQGGRHRRGADRVHRPHRQADAPGPVVRAQRAGRHRRARQHQDRGRRQDHHRLRHLRAMALGADWCNAARGFMFAVGCIQSEYCHTDRCPTGVATQDPTRQRALVVPDKIAAGRQLPSRDPARAGRNDRGRRLRSSAGNSSRSTSPAASRPARSPPSPTCIPRSPRASLSPAPAIRGGGSPGTWPTPIRSGRGVERTRMRK